MGRKKIFSPEKISGRKKFGIAIRNTEKTGYCVPQYPNMKGTAMSDQKTVTRPLHVIAAEINRTWPKVNFAARPYLDAMGARSAIQGSVPPNDGESVVLYFLSNASTWRGDDARRIKAELKALIK